MPEHIPDVDRTVQACRTLLKPRGLLIVNCPDNQGHYFTLKLIEVQVGKDISVEDKVK